MDDLGGSSRRRRRWAIRLVVGALAATIGVVLVTYVRRNFRRPKPRASVPALPKGVQRRVSGLTFTRSNGNRRVFTIHADRTLAYKAGGATILSNVTVEFYGRQGNRHDVLRTRRATYYGSSGNFSSKTDVRLELNAPPGALGGAAGAGESSSGAPASSRSFRQSLFLNTSGVTYDYQKALLQTTDPVQFRAGLLSGAAEGMKYATRAGWLEMDKDVTAVLKPQKGALAGSPVHLTASKLRFDKDARDAVLWGPVKVQQADRTGSAGHARILFDGRNRATRVKLDGETEFHQVSPTGVVELKCDQIEGTLNPRSEQIETLDAEGHVRAESRGKGGRGLFEAESLLLFFAGPKPERGRASGNVRADVFSNRPAQGLPSQTAPLAGASHERLTASQVDFTLWPGRAALKNATTPGEGKIILYPQDVRAGRRTITAGRFAFSFDPLGRLTEIDGSDGTRVVSAPPADSGKPSQLAVTTANNLVASFNPSSDTLRSVVQSGNFRFQQADDQARADKAVYSASNDSVLLTGHPEAWNAATRTQANRVVVGLASGITEGEGDVQVTRVDASSPSGLPTNILADRASVNQHTQTAHYSGNVRAWHGPDVIETSALDINRKEQTVHAGSPVVSSFMVSAAANKQKPGATDATAGSDPLTIRAKTLDYSVADHRATYQGGVALRTQGTVMRTDRLEVFFAGSGADQGLQVQRALAIGNVVVTQPGRRATGQRADYEAKSGRIVMTGGPPTLYDAARGVTSGRSLTFYTLDDRLLVEGGFNSTNPAIQHVAP